MKTNESTNACPKCGAPVPPEAPQGLCPQCVFVQAAAPEAAPTATSQIPSLERLAVAFPQLQILELIGRGGMGFVFKARQPHLDRFVALKLLPDSLAHDPQFAERFNREGRVLARLNHPNIVSIFDFGQAGGFYYLMMEYVDGVNLRQAMQAGRFSPAEALAIVPKICEALQFAHEEGILHRDIKPENILLDAKGRVKIADFGIAKLVGEEHPDVTLTATGAALGTMHYMAPEQIEKPSTVDHRADIYSLGVVFYELLTGELPLGRFGPPSAKTPVDSRVDDVVMRTLEKEREKRFQSAGEMGTTVEHLTEVGAGSFKGTPPKASGAERGAGETIAIKPEHVLADAPAWSKKAIWSAVLVTVSLVGPLFMAAAMLIIRAPIGGWKMVFTLGSISLPGIAGTILGWMALSDVSAGSKRLRGAAFAVFAALAWPVLLLSGFTIWLVVAPIRNFSASVPFASFLFMLVPAGLVTFIIWAIYTTTRKAAGRPAPHRRGVLKWIFLGLMLSALGLVVLAIPNASFFPASFRAGPQSEIHYRVFEVESAVADNLVPVAQRLTGATGNWQTSDISPETLAALLKDRVLKKHVMVDRRRPVPVSKSSRTIISTRKPGVKEAQQQVVVGWPIVSDNWSHGLHNRVSNDIAEVSGHGFFGVRRQDGELQLKVQHVVTHKIADRPEVDVNIAYEGKTPPTGALAFLIPFARKDDTTGYLVFAVEVNSVATEAEPVTNNTSPWIRFTFTAVELREVQGVRWLAIDYVDDVHGECQKAFPWETTIPGFKAETTTSEFLGGDEAAPVRHQRVEYRMPDSIRRDQLERLRDQVARTLNQKSFRLELGEEKLLFELFPESGGSLRARIKVIPPLKLSQWSGSPKYRQALALLESYTKREQELLAQNYTEENPLVIRVRQQIAEARERKNRLEPAMPMAPEPPTLQFRLVADDADAAAPLDVMLESRGNGTSNSLRVLRTVLLDGSAVARAGIVLETNGHRTIGVELTTEGARQFGAITAANINRKFVIIAGGRVLSAPIIRSAIPGGELQITGNMSADKVHKLVAELNRKPAGLEFSPTVERSLPRAPENPPGAIPLDLESGRFMTNRLFDPEQRNTRDLLKTTGSDLLAIGAADQIPVISAFDLASIEAPAGGWDSLTAEEVEWNWTLMRAAAKPDSLLATMPGRPDTLLFRTRENTFGLLQVLEGTNAAPEVKIRYKLVKSGESAERRRAQAQLEAYLKLEQSLLAEQMTDENPRVIYVRQQIENAREKLKRTEKAP
jgi:predicted Ser/Thr protein kinase